jgi:hypothetical protein
MAMHEIFMAGDQVQNASLFSWAAKALEGDAADMARKLFVKDQFEDLGDLRFSGQWRALPKI